MPTSSRSSLAAGDAVVVAGVKYRALWVSWQSVGLVEAGPSWRRGKVARKLDAAEAASLIFDRVAAVWRLPAEPMGGWEPRT